MMQMTRACQETEVGISTTEQAVPLLQVHVVTPVGLSAWSGRFGYLKFRKTEDSKEEKLKFRSLADDPIELAAYCRGWIATNEETWRKGGFPAVELEPLAAIMNQVFFEGGPGETGPGERVQMKLSLHLLMNFKDPDHHACAKFIAAFLNELCAPLIARNLGQSAGDVTAEVEPVDVAGGITDPVREPGVQPIYLSVLDERLETPDLADVPEPVINRVQQAYGSAVLDVFESISPDEAIFVCTKSGSTMAKGMLETLAVTYGAVSYGITTVRGVKTIKASNGPGSFIAGDVRPDVVRPGGQEFNHLSVSRSALRHTFSRAVAVMALQETGSQTEERIYRERLGLFLYLERMQPEGTPRYQLSELGRRLAYLDLPEDTSLDSACAGVLERSGMPGGIERARQLRGLTRLWADNQLWALNGVPELVLHGAGHGDAVDRNLANLCSPLLEEGKLEVDDVFTLACTAWLHDWGHAPSHYEHTAPTSANDIRDLHGLLTKKRLDDTLHYRHLHGLPRDVALRVGALAAHHQGWTSCSNVSPSTEAGNKGATAEKFFGAAPLSFDEELALAAEEIRRFHEEAPESVATESESQNHPVDSIHARTYPTVRPFSDPVQAGDLEKNHLLLALFRISDAADVGIHRVPDFNVLPSKLVDLWNAELADKNDLWNRDGTIQKRGGGTAQERETVRRHLSTTFASAIPYLVGELEGEHAREFEKRIDRAVRNETGSEHVRGELLELERRLLTLKKQYPYYQHHRRTWLTSLALRPSAGTGFYEIVAYVLENVHRPPLSGADDTGKALSAGPTAHYGVSEDIYREIGQSFKVAESPAAGDADSIQPADDAEGMAKDRIRQYLEQAGLSLSPARLIRPPKGPIDRAAESLARGQVKSVEGETDR